MKGIEAHFIGLDIGRATDHSALAVVARRLEQVDPAAIDFSHLIQKYYVVYLHRFSLGTEYEIVENECARVWKLPELIPTANYFMVDMTGVGAPIVESLRRNYHVPVNGIVITGGQTVNNPQANEWHIPKPALVTTLAKLVQTGRLKVLDGVEHSKELKDEFGSFGYKVDRDSGNVLYQAMEDKVHDDLIIAVALACWYGEKNVPSPSWPRKKAHVAEHYNPLTRR